MNFSKEEINNHLDKWFESFSASATEPMSIAMSKLFAGIAVNESIQLPSDGGKVPVFFHIVEDIAESLNMKLTTGLTLFLCMMGRGNPTTAFVILAALKYNQASAGRGIEAVVGIKEFSEICPKGVPSLKSLTELWNAQKVDNFNLLDVAFK